MADRTFQALDYLSSEASADGRMVTFRLTDRNRGTFAISLPSPAAARLIKELERRDVEARERFTAMPRPHAAAISARLVSTVMASRDALTQRAILAFDHARPTETAVLLPMGGEVLVIRALEGLPKPASHPASTKPN
jgi:hypothetical protein